MSLQIKEERTLSLYFSINSKRYLLIKCREEKQKKKAHTHTHTHRAEAKNQRENQVHCGFLEIPPFRCKYISSHASHYLTNMPIEKIV